MVEIKFTDEEITKAQKMADEMGALRNSITKGKGNLIGFMGEIAALRVYGGVQNNTKDYDLILPDGRKADVKSKKTTATPLPHYDCSVADYNTRQSCDIYIFTRIWPEEKIGWVLGHYEREKYYEDARFLRKGQIDGDNWFRVKADCWNMQISQLLEMTN
jgi:hypothetical protein